MFCLEEMLMYYNYSPRLKLNMDLVIDIKLPGKRKRNEKDWNI